MKKILMLAAAAAALLTFTPEPVDAQVVVRRGGGVRGPVVARRGVVVAPRGRYGYRGGYGYRRGGGWGPAAVGLGVLGAAAVGAAAAGAYGYGDPCLRQQQVYDGWGNVVWQTVRVC
jgi:hypothetical protein